MSFDGDLYPTAGASSVMTTKGDMVDFDTVRQRLGIGSTNQVLQVTAGGLPAWQTLATASSTWEKIGTASSTSGASEITVDSFTQPDLLRIFFYGSSAGTTEDDIQFTINSSSANYSMRGDYSANETSFQNQNFWSATFGNSTPQRPIAVEMLLWKQDSNVVGNTQTVGMMLGSLNIDVDSSPDIVNTWANSGLLWDDTSAITGITVKHGSDNVIGNLQLLGCDYG